MLLGIALVTLCVFLLIGVENDKWGLSTLALVLSFIILGLSGVFNVAVFVWTKPAVTALLLAGYMLVGSVWSTFKWWLYVKGRMDQYAAIRAKFLISLGLEPTNAIPEHEKKNFKNALNHANYHDGESIFTRPSARIHKSRITTWIAYWPWSMFWTLTGDVTKRVFKWTYEQLHDLFDRISTHVYQGVSADLEDTLLKEDELQ